MKQLIDEFNRVYPNYRAFPVCDYTFDEDSNLNKQNTLQHLTIKGINSYIIPNSLIKDATSIFNKAKSPDVLRKDNDGIILAEINGIKYVLICELKSSYTTSNIIKAKDQIVGAYIKLHSLFSLLASYNPKDWTVRGIIASFAPTLECSSTLQKKMGGGDRECSFCFKFQRDKKYVMPERNCRNFFFPLNVPEITLYHVSVPTLSTTHSIELSKIMI